MLQALDDNNRKVRYSVRGAFAACGYSPAVSRLLPWLRTADMDEAIEVVDCLCAIGEKAVCQLILFMADNKDTNGSHAAGSALKKMGPDVVGWILACLRDPIIFNRWPDVKWPVLAIMYDFKSEALLELKGAIKWARANNPDLAFILENLDETLKGLP